MEILRCKYLKVVVKCSTSVNVLCYFLPLLFLELKDCSALMTYFQFDETESGRLGHWNQEKLHLFLEKS